MASERRGTATCPRTWKSRGIQYPVFQTWLVEGLLVSHGFKNPRLFTFPSFRRLMAKSQHNAMSSWTLALCHPEFSSGSHREPLLVLLRGQMLKQVQHDVWWMPLVMRGSCLPRVWKPMPFPSSHRRLMANGQRCPMSSWTLALCHPEFSSGSHREPLLVLLRGQMLKQVNFCSICSLSA